LINAANISQQKHQVPQGNNTQLQRMEDDQGQPLLDTTLL
jgi:hypothetical protein